MITKLPTKTPVSSQISIFIFIIFVSILLAVRLVLFVAENGVNLLFWDEWDFLTPLFAGKNDLWTLFSWQHGLHRQGVGYFLIKIIADLSHWNTRFDEFSIAVTLILALTFTLILKRMVWSSFSLSDVILPFIVLNLIQYETLIGTPNISASALSLLLVIVYCISWIVQNGKIKYLAICILNFLMIFTGYALLIAPITIALLVIEIFQSRKDKMVIVKQFSFWALMGSILSVGAFFIDYKFQTGVTCFSLKPSLLLKYPVFISMMFAKFIRLDLLFNSTIMVLGCSVLVSILIAIFIFHLRKITRYKFSDAPQSLIIVILIGYSLLFAVSAAIGRACLGVDAALSSRYATLLVPAFIGLYLHIVSMYRRNYRRFFIGLVLLTQLISLFPFVARDAQTIKFYSIDKENWKRCYLQTKNYTFCNQETGFRVYPGDDARIESSLKFLEDNHLNLFLDDPIK